MTESKLQKNYPSGYYRLKFSWNGVIDSLDRKYVKYYVVTTIIAIIIGTSYV